MSYVNDILVTGAHRKDVFRQNRVLKIIEQTRFKINPHMAQLVQGSKRYLEVELDQSERTPARQRVEFICKLPVPCNITALRSSLGLIRFSREFIEGYTERAAPLYKFLKKGVPWKWGPELYQAVK